MSVDDDVLGDTIGQEEASGKSKFEPQKTYK